MVLGVGRIGIDLCTADKLKPCLARQLDHIILTHIAITRQGVLRLVRAAAMLFNPKDAAGLQDGVEV
jgi:hypothetical protein